MASMPAPRTLLLLLWLLLLSLSPQGSAWILNRSSGRPSPIGGGSRLAGMELPNHPSFGAAVTASGKPGCRSRGAAERDGEILAMAGGAPPAGALKLHLKHRSDAAAEDRKSLEDSVMDSAHRDLYRIQTLHRRITEKKNRNAQDRHRHQRQRHHQRLSATMLAGPAAEKPSSLSRAAPPELAGQLMATLESGVSLGSGEYFADVFVGTPPRHFSVILDTGSDLNWLQCLPCYDCFEQRGPIYDPSLSSSHRPVPCADRRCALVSSPEPPVPCRGVEAGASADVCPYFYWYGDRSNTTGDLALETFTVNLTAAGEGHRVEEVIFGCGHWNKGLFHGAAGLLGLGRGPLSFFSQLRSLYGGVFSYCLVDRNSDLSVSSKLLFGEDRGLMAHPELNFTTFAAGKENPADTFYYVGVQGVKVGGRLLDIPPAVWELTTDGGGGTIVDSGTTLTYFPKPAYRAVLEAFLSQVKGYPVVEGFPVLSPCFNVSGAGKVDLPEFAIVFADGAVWNFPQNNYFITLEQGEVACLAVLATPGTSPSILGNYLQQNFHVVYDADRSRLGFAPARCAEV